MPVPHQHPTPLTEEYRNLRAQLGFKRVGIVGCGGLGSNAAWMLVRSGIGTLVLADHDLVEESNLHRQFFFRDQVGMPKTEALSINLTRIDPAVNLELFHEHVDEQNFATIFSEIDLFIEAVDTARDKAMLVAVCSEQLPGVPIISASGLAGYGSANDIITRHLMGDLWMIGDLVSEVSEEHPLFASRVCVAAGHEAHMAIRILLGYPEA
ncbi:MAG: sulfur carrier protein ThiS adenylyltransferase ThiF [Coriobacteriia bacterium]|nr:sulfur carrier protein ThiS adenylyltransferase ThiF [Coriobacteriia bacterium]